VPKKQDAIAACRALKDEIKETTCKNAQFHDQSHWSEGNARNALANKTECGYYYKLHKYYYRESTKQTYKMEGLSPKIKKTCKLITEKLPIGVNDSFILIQHALMAGRDGKAIYKATDRNDRCLIIVELPKEYGATTLKRNDNDVQCTHYVLVVTYGAINSSLVTHFPCDQNYISRFNDLTD
jgi:hypothetical protein